MIRTKSFFKTTDKVGGSLLMILFIRIIRRESEHFCPFFSYQINTRFIFGKQVFKTAYHILDFCIRIWFRKE